MADLGHYTRMNDIIVSRLDTKPWLYVRAAVPAEGEPIKPDLESLKKQVITFFNRKGISVDCNDIEACHPLP